MMMTNLSAANLLPADAPWLPIAVAFVAVLLIVLIVRRTRSTSNEAASPEQALGMVAEGVPAESAKPTSAEDDAMMAAMIGAIKANEEQGAILAAITAAISVVWESEHPGTGFRVVSYRHVDKHSPWNAR